MHKRSLPNTTTITITSTTNQMMNHNNDKQRQTTPIFSFPKLNKNEQKGI